MNNTTKLILNHIFCHLMLIPAIMYGSWWMFLCGFIWWYVIAIVSISSGYHRYYSHRSFAAGKFYELMVNVLGIFSGAGPALTWAATHRQHHVYSDKIDDPHSYIIKGFCSVYFNLWGYSTTIHRKFIKPFLNDKLLSWFYRNYFRVSIGIIVVFSLIHPMLLIFGYAFPIVLAFHGYGILNVLGHKNGKTQNSWIANILTAGEGWHDNHHQNSKDFRIGRKWWQFDPTALFISLIKHD